MKKMLLNYYIGLLLTVDTDNLCTARLVRDLLPGVWLAVAGIFLALHSPLICALRTMLRVAGAELWGRNHFSNWFFIFESHFYHRIILETFVCKMRATDYRVFCRLKEVCTFNLDPLAPNSFFFWKTKWVECPVLFELLQDPTTHRFTNVKTKKIFL